jgi:hypothetical protein
MKMLIEHHLELPSGGAETQLNPGKIDLQLT